MSGETDLDGLLADLSPVRIPGEVVVVTGAELPAVPTLATVQEVEGVTAVVRRADADAHGLSYQLVAAWITLEVHSSLAAVGLTAAVSACLAEAGISCNVLAGFFHDHLLVPVDRAEEVVTLLGDLSHRHRR